MAKQTITVRLDEDDITLLSDMVVPGAANLSEKLRVLIADARRQSEGTREYGAAYEFARRLLAGPERCVHEAEARFEMRSELLTRVLAWLPDMIAVMVSGACVEAREGEAHAAALGRLERAVGERAIGLTDSIMQLAASGFPGCYDPKMLTERAQAAMRLQASVTTNDDTK
jgi:hypothetical protein